MYVSKKDLDTIVELLAYVDGAIESAEEQKKPYWRNLHDRTYKLMNKMRKQSVEQVLQELKDDDLLKP